MEQDPDASQRYLDELRRQLARLPDQEREDAVQEIASHIADAHRAGMPLAAIRGRLGDPSLRARAYESDYFLQQPLPADLRRGMLAHNTGAPITVPVGAATLGRVLVPESAVLYIGRVEDAAARSTAAAV